MTQRIIHSTPDEETGLPTNNITVIRPDPGSSLSIEEHARRAVPLGFPYKIISVDDLPGDRIFRDAWEADFSEPDGHGIGPEAWFIEQYLSEIAAIEAADDAAVPDKAERIARLNSQIAAMEQQQ